MAKQDAKPDLYPGQGKRSTAAGKIPVRSAVDPEIDVVLRSLAGQADVSLAAMVEEMLRLAVELPLGARAVNRLKLAKKPKIGY